MGTSPNTLWGVNVTKLNRWLLLIPASIVIIAIAAIARPAKGVNVVTDIPPTWDLYRRIDATMVALRTLPVAEHHAYMTANWPTLGRDITAWLRADGRIDAAPDSIVYFYGSAREVTASDGNGNHVEGFFNDELIAQVYPAGGGKPIPVIVRCLNGIFEIDGESLERVGTDIPIVRFTIAPGQGLTHHVDYQTAMMLAQVCELPLYRGRKQIETNSITVAQARAMEDSTDFVQISVHVRAGDEYDLGALTRNGRPCNAIR